MFDIFAMTGQISQIGFFKINNNKKHAAHLYVFAECKIKTTSEFDKDSVKKTALCS